MIRVLSIALAGLLLAAPPALAKGGGETLSAGIVKNAVIYHPKDAPKTLVLFLSGDGGWNLGVVSMAKSLAAEGAVVAGISTPGLLKALDAEASTTCDDLGAALMAFAGEAAPKLGLPPGAPVVIAGYSSGATLVYLAQASAAGSAMRGGIALGFCPDLKTKKPVCLDPSLNPATDKLLGFIYPPQVKGVAGFTALQGLQDEVCSPPQTITFIGQIPGAKVVELPKVGHGFGVEKNWMPQYLAAYRDIVGDSGTP